MSPAKPFAILYLAAVFVLALGLVISYQGTRAPPPPRLEFSWSTTGVAPWAHNSAPALPSGGYITTTPGALGSAVPPEQGDSSGRTHASSRLPARLDAAHSNKNEIVRVEERLEGSLPRELYDDFKLFLYVSKADSGPWAQRMFVFRKMPEGDLGFLYAWPVSTGRERLEYDSAGSHIMTNTPAGFYELDPDRFFVRHSSSEWHEPMPYAMFFNWIQSGSATGLAIHSAAGADLARLGHRASSGCIHLSPEAARTLFDLIRAQYKGTVPRFVVDANGTMSNAGLILRGTDGRPQFERGYKVLVFIEDFGGRNVIAAMD